MISKLRHWLAHRVPGLPYPIFCFGGLVCIHSGQWADINVPGGLLVVQWRKNHRWMFYSPDGTPQRAKWFLGKYSN